MSILLASLLAATAAAPVPATPSFDCNRATTRVETMICADGDLAMSDRAMAYFYSRRAKGTSLFQPHAQWLEQRDACSDADCVRAAYETHILDLGMAAKLSSAYRTKDEEGSLALHPLGGGWYAFYVQSIHIHRDAMGPNVADDEAAGAVLIQGGRGAWRDTSGCTISFARQAGGWQIERRGECSGSVYASINGLYRS